MALTNPLATNLSPLTTAATTIGALGDIVVVTPRAIKGYQPLPPLNFKRDEFIGPLPTALLFHYEGEQIATLESDITDHVIEDNSSIVDHIGIKPEIFKTSGFIGELNNVLPTSLQVLQRAANTLTSISAYLPSLSITALIAYNQALLLYENAASIARSAVSAYTSFSTGEEPAELLNAFTQESLNSGTLRSSSELTQNRQQLMFQQLYGYWYSRTLFNIQTPWCIFTNMAILSFRAIQDAETKVITDYEVTFKKIRTATTQFEDAPIEADRAAIQSAEKQNNTITSGDPGHSLGDNIAKVK